MRYLSALLALAVLSAGAPALLADSIPYANPGTIAPETTLTATATGSIIGYFVSQSAGNTSVIRLVDVTSGYTSGYFFNNHATAPGTTQNFGSVNAGDTLVF